ncbi:MAG: hypothetical protein ABWZ76_11010 [Acidimicrobiales bacterium]
MFTFTRSIRLAAGHLRDSTAWALELTEKVNQISEVPFSLWRPLFSPSVTTLTWGTLVEELEELEAVDAKLMADDTYVALVERGAAFSSGDPVNDALVNYVHADFSRAREAQCLSVVETTIANGSFAKAIGVGVAIAERVEAICGLPTGFGIHTTGTYGRVQWMTGFPSVAEMQRAEAAINGDPSFLEMLDRDAAEVFLPGSGEQRIARRIM